EIDPQKYIAGQNVSEWVNANRPNGSSDHGTPMSQEEIESRMSALDPQALAPYQIGKTKTFSGPPALKRKNKLQTLVDAGRMGPGNNVLATRLGRLKGSAIESAMVSPSMAQAAGFDPSAAISPQAVRRGSPFGRMNPTVRRATERSAR